MLNNVQLSLAGDWTHKFKIVYSSITKSIKYHYEAYNSADQTERALFFLGCNCEYFECGCGNWFSDSNLLYNRFGDIIAKFDIDIQNNQFLGLDLISPIIGLTSITNYRDIAFIHGFINNELEMDWIPIIEFEGLVPNSYYYAIRTYQGYNYAAYDESQEEERIAVYDAPNFDSYAKEIARIYGL